MQSASGSTMLDRKGMLAMKAALQKSVKDAQVRDSFNKESMALIKSNAWFELVGQLNKLERVLPRNASKLHSCVIMNENGEVYLLNFEVLEVAKTEFRPSQVGKLPEPTESVVIGDQNENSQEKEEEQDD